VALELRLDEHIHSAISNYAANSPHSQREVCNARGEEMRKST